MRLMIPAAWNAARAQTPGPGAGPWADPFDDPAGTILWSRWVAGSTAGTAKVNCDLFSKKVGFSGAQSACEWRTLTGATGRVNVELLNWEALAAGPMIIRLRAKVETTAASKLWLLFNTVYVNPLWDLAIDITPDATPPEARVGHHSAHWSDVWVEEHPDYPGWMFLKARLDLSGASDVDGAFTLHMTDADQGDELFPVDGFTLVRVQELMVEEG